jgi:hypothetical protein
LLDDTFAEGFRAGGESWGIEIEVSPALNCLSESITTTQLEETQNGEGRQFTSSVESRQP